MGKYDVMKSKPNWESETARILKAQFKNRILLYALQHKSRSECFEAIDKAIAEFVREIPDPKVSKSYLEELTSFAEKVWHDTQYNIGALTPKQFASALMSKGRTFGRATLLVNMDEKTAKQLANAWQGQENGILAYNVATPGGTFNRDVQTRVKELMNDLVNSDYDDGSHNLRNIAEMTARYEAQQENKKALVEAGTKLVYVPPHANCSKRCQPWQGRVYSLDGTSGEIDGRKYVPIETATDVYWHSNRTGRDYPNGLFSYNCRHEMRPYERGQNIEHIPADVIAQTRAKEETQREMERTYRKLRTKEMLLRSVAYASKDKQVLRYAQKIRAQSIQLRKEYVAFSEKNDLVVYPERLKMVVGEYYQKDENDQIKNRQDRYSIEKILTNARNQSILLGKIDVGEISTKINPEKQKPHMFDTRVENKSYFNEGITLEDLQNILNKMHGTGKVQLRKDGTIKEIIDVGDRIATVVSKDGKIKFATKKIRVHYAKDRTHIVPVQEYPHK